MCRQVGHTKRNPDGYRSVWIHVSFTNPHLNLMKYIRNGAFALILSMGLGSCALSYQYCDAYNGVSLESPETVESVTAISDCVD